VPTPRYRCAACGNLTRFDVTVTTTEKAFYHYSVGGELTIEDSAVVAHRVDEVSCRWCGHGRSVEVVDEVASTDDVPSESTD
jgi:DNA-directed RNA polymerase subunit RPC12/RpoP